MARAEPAPLNRRALLLAGAVALTARTVRAATSTPFVLSGRPIQGGAVIGRTLPGAALRVNGEEIGAASAGGYFLVGFDRDEKPEVSIAVRRYGAWEERPLPVAPAVYDVQRIDGLPPEQVTPSAPELLERIRREAAMKAKAFASLDPSDGFHDGFVLPVTATRTSSSFGGQRILNGVPGTPHYGLDLAAPTGTPIRAPAAGLVVLAEPDMHFEGGLTLIDQGQGLVSMYLHQSKVLVRAGERVQRGQVIGAVGQTGRATGPHLCWRLKWRNRNMNPGLLVGVVGPAGGSDHLSLD